MDSEQKLTKRERVLLKKEQKESERLSRSLQKKLKKFLRTTIVILIIGGGILGIGRLLTSGSSAPESEIISKQGIHWHADLSVNISGQYQTIPSNIGLGITERYIHTHGSDGVIHMEFPSLVKKSDIRLGRFFEIWGKTFNRDCIFDKCLSSEGQVKMLVNGEPNHEFENYIMQNGDKIEIAFE